MGAAAARLSDACIVTSDNPRSEEPLSIISQIAAGMPEGRYAIIPDRARAIATAIEQARLGTSSSLRARAMKITRNFPPAALISATPRKCAATCSSRNGKNSPRHNTLFRLSFMISLTAHGISNVIGGKLVSGPFDRVASGGDDARTAAICRPMPFSSRWGRKI